MRSIALAVLLSAILAAKSPGWDQARELYQRTQYRQSLDLLLAESPKDGGTLQMIGQDYFMLGEYKKATETLEKASSMEPDNSELFHWLGRAYGRRAETAGPFSAPGLANKARQMFEKSVLLDPNNKEALHDLFDYYLQAPGFLGGGYKKAEKVAGQIARLDPAEGHYAQAQLAQKRKEYSAAEQHLLQAAKLAPQQVGRVLDVATFLAKRGQFEQSEAMFDKAAHMAPDDPAVLYAHADAYVKEHRDLGQAGQWLQSYVRAPLTPDDPPRQQAEKLLQEIGS